jgi:hypothetical protein
MFVSVGRQQKSSMVLATKNKCVQINEEIESLWLELESIQCGEKPDVEIP